MQFEVTDSFHEYSPWQKAWEAVSGFLTIFWLPFAYGKHFWDKLRRIEQPVPRQQNVWQSHVELGSYEIQSIELGNEESEQLMKSEVLDFPIWKDWEDPFRCLWRLRSRPEIEELNDVFFDEIGLKTELGLFVVRINKKGEGMTLCLLPSHKPSLVEVLKMEPLSWRMRSPTTGVIALWAFADRGKYTKEIKLIAS